VTKGARGGWEMALQQRLDEVNRRLEELLGSPQSPALSEEIVGLFQEKQKLLSLAAEANPARRVRSVEVRLRDPGRDETHSGSILSNVNCELSKLEKRDWELWWIVSATGILMGCGLLAMLVPAAFTKTESLHFDITVPRQLVIGLMALLILLNTYLVSRRLELRRLRQRTISSTIQNELVRLQSFTDPLTEVYNRRSLEDLAHRYISHARRLKKPLTFLLIDVDHFKRINTRFGHLTGDFVLVEIAALLRTSVRGCDAVIRYGGDEFLTVVADASAEHAQRVVDRMQSSVAEWNKAAHLEDCHISLSIGVAEWTEGKTLDEVLDLADQDMYAKKEQLASKADPQRAERRSSDQVEDRRGAARNELRVEKTGGRKPLSIV
jgi:diguanylate cyclase (GGDEF)-like protein